MPQVEKRRCQYENHHNAFPFSLGSWSPLVNSSAFEEYIDVIQIYKTYMLNYKYNYMYIKKSKLLDPICFPQSCKNFLATLYYSHAGLLNMSSNPSAFTVESFLCLLFPLPRMLFLWLLSSSYLSACIVHTQRALPWPPINKLTLASLVLLTPHLLSPWNWLLPVTVVISQFTCVLSVSSTGT